MGTNACPSVHHIGGIRSITLYGAGEVSFEGYDPVGGGFRRAMIAPTATPLEMHFADNGARYVERLVAQGVVEHRLEILSSGFAPERMARLMALSSEGVVAILTLASGGSWVVGYSHRGGADYPLRLLEAESDTFAQRSQMPSTRLLLGSEDGWAAAPLKGV